MTSHREWFHQYEPISRGLVYMGNDRASKIINIGSIKVKKDDGLIHTILEVLNVKGLNKTLPSIGQLDDLGYEFHAKQEIMKVIKCALVVMKTKKITENLYILHERTYKHRLLL